MPRLTARWAGARSSVATRRGLWRALVPLVCVAAGLLFVTSAQTARGTDLRAAQSDTLLDTVRSAELDVQKQAGALAALQAQVTATTNQAGQANAAVAAAQRVTAPLLAPSGLTAVTGPGITVVLDDAHSVPANVDPNQLVVHQSDLQSVVNALWAGGAEAMTVSGQRIIATSAVRCVGNTLLLNGRVFSPPFRVLALGPFDTMRSALDRSPGVELFKQAASYYGLGYTVAQNSQLTLPAYAGSISLTYAKVATK